MFFWQTFLRKVGQDIFLKKLLFKATGLKMTSWNNAIRETFSNNVIRAIELVPSFSFNHQHILRQIKQELVYIMFNYFILVAKHKKVFFFYKSKKWVLLYPGKRWTSAKSAAIYLTRHLHLRWFFWVFYISDVDVLWLLKASEINESRLQGNLQRKRRNGHY